MENGQDGQQFENELEPGRPVPPGYGPDKFVGWAIVGLSVCACCALGFVLEALQTEALHERSMLDSLGMPGINEPPPTGTLALLGILLVGIVTLNVFCGVAITKSRPWAFVVMTLLSALSIVVELVDSSPLSIGDLITFAIGVYCLARWQAWFGPKPT